jgi:lipoprotein NlpD
MIELRSQGRMWAVAMLMGALLAGCASGPRAPAPVEDRSPAGRSQPPALGVETPAVAEPIKPLPGAENVGKPGYYTVRPGDTLIRIALDSGQNWRDITR